MNLKEKMGITLIALVITIVVILILAAVTLNLTLGNKGIVKRAQEATLMNSKAQYYQEIDMEIVDEKMERSAKYKEEPFITSLANRLSPERKEWVTSVVKCAEVDGSIEKKENDMDNNLLLIMTKEGYEIFVDVNNSQLQASIRNDWKKEQKACTITYNANGGSSTPAAQTKTYNVALALRGAISRAASTANGYTVTFNYYLSASDLGMGQRRCQ